jgi:hypothetical protein
MGETVWYQATAIFLVICTLAPLAVGVYVLIKDPEEKS